MIKKLNFFFYNISIFINAIAKTKMTDDEKKDHKDLKDLKDQKDPNDQNDKDIIQIKKNIKYLNNAIYDLEVELKNYEQILNNNDQKIKELKATYASKEVEYNQVVEMLDYNLQQLIKELNEINNNRNNENLFIVKSQHKKLHDKTLEISKLLENIEIYTSTKSTDFDDNYSSEIKEIQDKHNIDTMNMNKKLEQINKKRIGYQTRKP